MSWSITMMGTREKVREACDSEFDKSAKAYAGQEEEKDVLSAKERCLSAIDSLKLDEFGNAVSVRCSGSRSTYSCNINVSVERISLKV
jgi:hypothetical protein